MPELPEVETVRRGLNQVTRNQAITGGDVLLERTIAHPFSVSEFLAGVKGTAIAQWHRRGKYLLAELIKQDYQSPKQPITNLPAGWLGIHLRMTGQLLWLHPDDPLQKHARVRLFFSGQELRFVDQRTFGQMWWVPPGMAVTEAIAGLAKLGPEPFSADFSLAYLAAKLRNRQRPIKNALLDQSVVAGIGNIYADEALFLSKILPQTQCTNLLPAQTERLHGAITQVLEASIAAGGTTFSNFLNLQGVNGNYSGIAWVYNRAGEPCRVCNTPIQRLRLAGRSAHYCPSCQR